MTRLLLDTHVLLWALYEPKKLSKTARDLIKNPQNERLVSAVTAFEISTKFRLGKLPIADSLLSNYYQNIQRFMGTEMPITTAHSLAAGSFNLEHRDPFDRILAAQSLVEDTPLVSADQALLNFPIRTIW